MARLPLLSLPNGVEGSWAAGLFAKGPWSPTRAMGRAATFVGVCVMIAVVLGRPDLIVLATPFALGTGWSLRRRPTVAPTVTVAVAEDSTAEGERFHTVMTVTNPNPIHLDVAVARLTYSLWLYVRHGDRPYATDLAPARTTEVTLLGTALRWGYQQLGPASVYAAGCDGLLLSGRHVADPARVRVHPERPVFRADDEMPVSSALVGVHRSRRPGEGGELAGVRRYSPGDRLRRVDWRLTLRTNEPYVVHTLSDRDAEVVILLDVLEEAGQSGGIRGTASVVDTCVRAAAGIAEHYLRQGDRVSLLEYSGHPRRLRAAAGRKQLQLVTEWLLATRSTAGSGDPPTYGIGPHLIPTEALVVVLSPLLSPRSGEMIATLAQAGRTVLVVDTLGDLARRVEVTSRWRVVAHRLWWLERAGLIGQLREAGVPVAPWAGAGTLDAMLRDMTRVAAAPRIGVR
jgi:uncharacterized protein (DUF58 family)